MMKLMMTFMRVKVVRIGFLKRLTPLKSLVSDRTGALFWEFVGLAPVLGFLAILLIVKALLLFSDSKSSLREVQSSLGLFEGLKGSLELGQLSSDCSSLLLSEIGWSVFLSTISFSGSSNSLLTDDGQNSSDVFSGSLK